MSKEMSDFEFLKGKQEAHKFNALVMRITSGLFAVGSVIDGSIGLAKEIRLSGSGNIELAVAAIALGVAVERGISSSQESRMATEYTQVLLRDHLPEFIQAESGRATAKQA
jgi:hypothetical protein